MLRRVAFNVHNVCVVLWLVLALGGVSTVAQADDEESRASGDSVYEELIDHAVTEFRHGNYPEAYSLFERAHTVQPSARTLRGLGIAAFEDRRYVKCVEHLQDALKDQRKPLTESQREKAAELVQRASGYLTRYTLDLSPAEAKVMVDSRPPVIVEGTLLLDPGEHEIVVSAAGRQETRRVRAQPNESLVLSINLSDTAANEEPSWWTARRKAGLVMASVGTASLVASLGLTLKARSEGDAADCGAGVCPSDEAKAQYEHGRALGTAATATVVAGAALAVGGAALLFWPAKENPENRDEGKATARVAPALSPMFAGIQVGGRW